MWGINTFMTLQLSPAFFGFGDKSVKIYIVHTNSKYNIISPPKFLVLHLN